MTGLTFDTDVLTLLINAVGRDVLLLMTGLTFALGLG